MPKRLQTSPIKALALHPIQIPMLGGIASRLPLLIGLLTPIIGLLSLRLAVLARI